MGQFFSLSMRKDRSNEKHGLILYYHPFSFYSQKVLFVLHEKNIPCTLHEVDVTNGEQCSDWFIHMNPKLDIPVLQNGPLIVPSSNQIICYLDANFNRGEHDLFPSESTKRSNEIVSIHRKISRLPIGIISLGTFIHSDIVRQPKLPFIALLRSRFLQTEVNMMDKLAEFAKHNAIHRDALLHKVKLYKDKFQTIREPEQFHKLIDAVDGILTDIEQLLVRQNDASNEWICGDRFTVADISLGMFLHRLHMLGLAKHFWGDGKPYLLQYYRRITARTSFQRALPTTAATLRTIWYKIPMNLKLCSCSVAVIVCGVSVYYIMT